MTKEVLKHALNAQRYFLISLIGNIENKDETSVREIIEYLWSTTSELGEMAGISKDLKNHKDIIQHAQEIAELEHIYELEISENKSKPTVTEIAE